MIPLKIKQVFFTIFFSIQNDDRFGKNIIPKLSIKDNGNRVLEVNDLAKKNICLITYSSGGDHFKIEHWGGIENTAFNIQKTPELVLTSIVQNKDGYVEQIKLILNKSFQYDTIYSQWLHAGNKQKIPAYPFENKKLNDLHETEVLVKNHQGNTYLVTNTRNQVFVIDTEEFTQNFELKLN